MVEIQCWCLNLATFDWYWLLATGYNMLIKMLAVRLIQILAGIPPLAVFRHLSTSLACGCIPLDPAYLTPIICAHLWLFAGHSDHPWLVGVFLWLLHTSLPLFVPTSDCLKASLIIIGLWVYSIGSCIPPFFGWGSYAAEGLLLTCSYDYIKQVILYFWHFD